ncbi:hypothetical protein HYPSUDRAFT_45120 [Hypholoma sublateritium FD-334 SS-4]|uniref:Uncharacterized protein n=1 Tax=Hypholoma sublateritium (strain FD-334 SS-4) TaxID=945553 RepID=A0A0D2KV88_HYPSF|nr:hypothetical protein HYPSUDRAFT_45120 [Hypholoma sublateritium FD-334 SS-4]
MSRLVFQHQSQISSTVNLAKRWTTSLGFWGAGAGAAALLFLSVTPLVRREVLEKTPLLGLYYQDKTPASDKPF